MFLLCFKFLTTSKVTPARYGYVLRVGKRKKIFTFADDNLSINIYNVLGNMHYILVYFLGPCYLHFVCLHIHISAFCLFENLNRFSSNMILILCPPARTNFHFLNIFKNIFDLRNFDFRDISAHSAGL